MNAGEKFRRIRKLLDFSLTQFSRLFHVSPVTISTWEKTEPLFRSNHIHCMIEVGLNPMYMYIDEKMTWPGSTEDQVKKNIRKKLEENDDEKEV